MVGDSSLPLMRCDGARIKDGASLQKDIWDGGLSEDYVSARQEKNSCYLLDLIRRVF